LITGRLNPQNPGKRVRRVFLRKNRSAIVTTDDDGDTERDAQPGASMPESLLLAIIDAFQDRYYGLESLALASIVERASHSANIAGLPNLPGVAIDELSKLGIARAWFRGWQRLGFWLGKMPAGWW
jgi:hypothetical protein